MKKVPRNPKTRKARLELAELVRWCGQRRHVRVVGEFLPRKPVSEDRPWAMNAGSGANSR
jgi:hypothetical protein